MNNSTVNQALLDLEEGLKEVDSAKNQVLAVTEQSELLVKAFNNILSTLNSLEKEFDEHGNGFSRQVNEASRGLNSQVQKSLEDMVIVQSDNEQQLKSRLNHLISEIDGHTKKILSFNTEIEKAKEKVQLLDFNQMAASLSSQIKGLERNLSNNHLENTERLTKQLKQTFSQIEASQSTTKTAILVAMAIGFAGLAALIYFT